MLAWLAVLGLAAAQSALDVTFEGDTGAEVAAALAVLREGRFEEAARALQALCEAGGGPDLHRLHGVARYEAGQLALAESAAAAGLAAAPDDPALLLLRGLVLADQGRGDAALEALAKAEAHAGGDRGLLARVALDRALVFLDRGEADAAEAALSRAAELGAGDPEVDALLAEDRAVLAALRGGRSEDALDAVGRALSSGDLGAARAAIPKAAADRRSRIRAALAAGAVERAEGRTDAARRTLDGAVTLATESGLVRERAAALGALGVVYAAGNRPEAARARLEEALGLVGGTSLRVLELGLRVEAGRNALRAGDPAGAAAHLAGARKLAASTTDASAAARIAELAGLIAAARGDDAAALASHEEALAAWQARGANAEVARVGCAAIEAVAGTAGSDAKLAALRSRTLAAFQAAHDPLGPAHASVAEGLGRAHHGDLDGAMTAFVAAAEAAEAVGSDRGKQVAAVARENAAKALSDHVGSAALLAEASKWGLEELVATRARYVEARSAYDAGKKAYEAKDWPAAVRAFGRSAEVLEGLGEAGQAAIARRGHAWAEWNATTAAAPAVGFPVWSRLVEEATVLGDAELRARARAAAALAAADLGRPEARRSLELAADEAEAAGLRAQAGQCRAALVKLLPELAEKVTTARRAFVLRGGDPEGRHALYQAAYAAYQAEDYDLAVRLCDEILPGAAGDLKAAIAELRAGADASRGGE